jgi:hypothetical protein
MSLFGQAVALRDYALVEYFISIGGDPELPIHPHDFGILFIFAFSFSLSLFVKYIQIYSFSFFFFL